ncbi:MAG: pyridine nucleotide-disulfide oxidoreductase, partial [Promethearchaeota archaeon]
MKDTDVFVIGGSAAGIIAAVTGKSCYPDKEFLLVRKQKQVLVPCAIPYIFGSITSDKNIIGDAVLTDAGVEIMVGEVVSIDSD